MSRTRGSPPAGVLVSGLSGSGKTTVVEEIADILETEAVPYAALDLDWLWWLDVPRLHRPAALQVLFRNLASIANVYLEAGVTRFAMASSVRDALTWPPFEPQCPFRSAWWSCPRRRR